MAPEPTAPILRRTRRGSRFLRGALFGVLLLVVAVLSLIAGFYVAVARTLPSLELTETQSEAQTTKIFDDSSSPVLLAELHGLEDRETLSADAIPEILRNAVVAVEDEHFYEHSGVDFFALLKALWAQVFSGEVVQGGSTITQELIRNAFLTEEQEADRGLRAAALAYQLERQWSKEKILTEYLNVVYFGDGAYGIEAAALTYFGVHAVDLSLDQAALLAGLPESPTTYSPRRNPHAALARRDAVLNKMYQQGYIGSSELQEAMSVPLTLFEGRTEDEVTLPYWVEMVREQLVARYGASTVLAGGLRVYVSADLELQRAAEESIAEILDQPDDPSAALVTIDVKSGRLVAMVGGSDFADFRFNLATQARGQPGSAFEPFVLVAAIEQGMSPDTVYESGPFTAYLPTGPWFVPSSESGPLTLAQATAKSAGGVYARLIMDIGPKSVAEVAGDMGITTPLGDDPDPSIATGELTTGVTLLEMAMAYTTLATGGKRLSSGVLFDPEQTAYPITIVRVTDAEGRMLDANTVVDTRVLEESAATMVTDCLTRVITSGTGTAANIGRPVAGQTGTTQDYADAWFIGYTPELVTAVWVGYPAARTPMTDVHGINITGGSLPARIWATFMRKALTGVPVSHFPSISSEDWVSVDVCSESHLLPSEYCPDVTTMQFRVDEQPTETCTLHTAQEIVIPRVVGLSYDDASRTLIAAGLGVRSVDDTASLEPAGTVVDQSPRAGTKLLQGSKVTLSVSTGEAITTVPELVGLDLSDAKAQLSTAGLQVDAYPVSDDTPAGTVLSQDPAPGATVPVGWHVSIYYSTGPDESLSP